MYVLRVSALSFSGGRAVPVLESRTATGPAADLGLLKLLKNDPFQQHITAGIN